ncbi:MULTISPECIES: diaminopimelate decarboxylase [Duncaniella]|jgi:diaminopimelate decarboxylase|uniref:Diaminopimelate decarboxylase n=4 Tax=Duncaniella muris TaxID=2094150 RepID=A0A2V1IUE6_9BACT|nr:MULTISPECIES: diaminopimelate decarboxylase [Duncaniella]NBH92117.1 diaminopimelate decarboxylase [Muribaculaceae bacterium S4]NBI20602.1 diaminopimelate decarboxylase [Muribaculaceae bacterium Z1]ROS91710.1 diaminopimelate decarboxylase [Muribaculaceae bacterium Isolate-039 (Harlan)]ROS96400.1 diaminopimelate decarboxylase [Muribaculaceae bacterium Isolate-077 (Janvier)]ROS97604.1 diaminopimelate decarboxylase [Muribaculaceae bacterium Isolate-083 (Janvier)]ROT00057.1 diaminopimelate deca
MTRFPIEEFSSLKTPFYFYDLRLLERTVKEIRRTARDPRFKVHYAIKANANPGILRTIQAAGFGVDCVSGWEIEAAIEAGFRGDRIVFAGVGKSDPEIRSALEADIECFNVESEPELRVISEIAAEMGKTARVAIRVNPNIDAHTHAYITTGLAENKFGINLEQLDSIIGLAKSLPAIDLKGLHFHIGSQITETEPFVMLCETINRLQDEYEQKGVKFSLINVGGGLGIDYAHPERHPIPDFEAYFTTFHNHLRLRPDQELHFELGRSVVAQCGSLITRVLYIKEGTSKRFAIVDAGMSDLIRPALYSAHHKIENISNPNGELHHYDVVGPICESSDRFGESETLPEVKRGDLLALRSAGAYGEIMASRYNCRPFPHSYFSEN